MKIFDNLRGKAAIQGTADRFGQSPEEVRREIQAAIDAAWDTDDLAAMKLQRSDLRRAFFGLEPKQDPEVKDSLIYKAIREIAVKNALTASEGIEINQDMIEDMVEKQNKHLSAAGREAKPSFNDRIKDAQAKADRSKTHSNAKNSRTSHDRTL